MHAPARKALLYGLGLSRVALPIRIGKDWLI